MGTIKFKTLHVSVLNAADWQLLSDLHEQGWGIVWEGYDNKQWHFILSRDE